MGDVKVPGSVSETDGGGEGAEDQSPDDRWNDSPLQVCLKCTLKPVLYKSANLPGINNGWRSVWYFLLLRA